MIFDIIKAFLPSVLIIAFMRAFSLLYPNIWLPFLIYPLAITPFTYILSFIFQTEVVAQSFTIFIHFVFGGVGPIVAFSLRTISGTKKIGDILGWVLKLVPSFCLTDIVGFQAGRDKFLWVRKDIKDTSDWNINLSGGNLMFLIIHFVLWSIVLFIIESGCFKFIYDRLAQLLSKNKIQLSE